MSAPLPPLHALSIVHPTPRLRPAPRLRASPGVPLLVRLWTWLMAPIDHHGQPGARAQLLAQLRRQELPPPLAGDPR
jgi:hypothetical protein